MIATEAENRLMLPPLFAAHPVEAAPFAAACAAAAEAGAGALYVAERPGLLALAVVLEPDLPLAAARRVFPVCMAALADALAAHCLPERTVEIGWPDVLMCNAGRIGGGRLGWPPGADEAAVPDWLVFGADLIRDRDAIEETGHYPDTTSLAEEQFDSIRDLVEGFARNLMYRLDTWAERGFEQAADGYLRRLVAGAGDGARIGPTGDLLVPGGDGASPARSLIEGLEARLWFDPARDGPRL
jgi:hypothetical protein